MKIGSIAIVLYLFVEKTIPYKNMYHKYLETKICKNGTGIGVFTTIQIPKNVPIIEISGTIYKEENLPDKNHPALLQVGPDLFIGPSGKIDDYINHSCDPNCYLQIIGNRAILYSLYVISANTEITFDYSTSSTDTLDKWQMNCLCGSYKCRKIISGLQYLDKSIIKEYENKNMIPMFMKNRIFNGKI